MFLYTNEYVNTKTQSHLQLLHERKWLGVSMTNLAFYPENYKMLIKKKSKET